MTRLMTSKWIILSPLIKLPIKLFRNYYYYYYYYYY